MTKARDIASAAPAPSTVSATEIGYLDGVTSAIQTQIDSKIGSASAISPTLIDAKGDLIVGSAADTAARLAVGTNNHVLTADSSTSTGLKWAAAAGGSGPTVSAESSTFQNISQSTNTKIDLQTENWDTDGAFASSRFTPLTSGYYQLNGLISFEANGTQRTMFAKNGSVIQPVAGFAANNPGITVSTIVYLNGTTDYVELYGYSDFGSTPRRAYNSFFSAIFIRS